MTKTPQGGEPGRAELDEPVANLRVPREFKAAFGEALTHVERSVVMHNAIELALPHAAGQRGAFDEIIARHRKDASFRETGNRMSGAPDALEKDGDAMR